MLFQWNSKNLLDFEKPLLQSDRFQGSKNRLFLSLGHIPHSDERTTRPTTKIQDIVIRDCHCMGFQSSQATKTKPASRSRDTMQFFAPFDHRCFKIALWYEKSSLESVTLCQSRDLGSTRSQRIVFHFWTWTDQVLCQFRSCKLSPRCRQGSTSSRSEPWSPCTEFLVWTRLFSEYNIHRFVLFQPRLSQDYLTGDSHECRRNIIECKFTKARLARQRVSSTIPC
jgi:hypothetical protein